MLIDEAIMRLDTQIVEPGEQVIVKIVEEEVCVGEDGVSDLQRSG